MAKFVNEGDEIEYNSDPDDLDYKHIYYGKIMKINKNRKQIKIERSDDKLFYTYFIDEIKIEISNKINEDDNKNPDEGITRHDIINQDRMKRISWKLGCKVEIYSEEAKKWFEGEIMRIFNDTEGEWLVVRFAFGMKTKEVGRFTKFIRPIDSFNVI